MTTTATAATPPQTAVAVPASVPPPKPSPSPVVVTQAYPAARRFTAEDYRRMIEARVLTEHDRVELIHGRIIEKMPIGSRHAATVNSLTRRFAGESYREFILSSQNPIVIRDDGTPEPDLALLGHRDDFYAGQLPTADDVHLVIEVSDTTLAFDRDVKGPLYAAAGIAEYWIVDLIYDRIEIRREPSADGVYGSLQTFARGQTLESSDEKFRLSVDELLPPPAEVVEETGPIDADRPTDADRPADAAGPTETNAPPTAT